MYPLFLVPPKIACPLFGSFHRAIPPFCALIVDFLSPGYDWDFNHLSSSDLKIHMKNTKLFVYNTLPFNLEGANANTQWRLGGRLDSNFNLVELLKVGVSLRAHRYPLPKNTGAKKSNTADSDVNHKQNLSIKPLLVH